MAPVDAVSAQTTAKSDPALSDTAHQRAQVMLDKTAEMAGRRKPCPDPNTTTDIVVCGRSDTKRTRLSEMDREAAGMSRDPIIRAPDPHAVQDFAAPVGPVSQTKLPKKWRGMEGRLYVPPERNVALEQVKRAEAAAGKPADSDSAAAGAAAPDDTTAAPAAVSPAPPPKPQ